MRILLLASHAVAEYDDIRMFTDLGHDVFCPGGYQNPRESGEGLRPSIPNAAYHPELIEACEQVRRENGDPGQFIDWAKAKLHPDVLDWADVIICHHFPEQWLAAPWSTMRHKRVIWRTCGQSDPTLETVMAELREDGLQIVRYSPAEEGYFKTVGSFAGQDALIRFGKYPDDYGPWIGDRLAVGNLTQDMVARGDACGYDEWTRLTAQYVTAPAGQGSEALPGGLGKLDYPEMLAYLASLRAYLYTGTRYASYTLGLIEAMLSGVPVIPVHKFVFGQAHALYEADEIVGFPNIDWPMTQVELARLMNHDHARMDCPHPRICDATEGEKAAYAVQRSASGRARAIELFDVATVGQQWQEFLS